MTEVEHKLAAAVIQAHTEVACRRQGSRRQEAAVWPMLWLRLSRREIKRLLIVVSCHSLDTNCGRHTNKINRRRR